MDPAAAAIAGAAIGGGATLLAGFVGPWIRDVVGRRADAQARKRELLRTGLSEYMTALIDYLQHVIALGQKTDHVRYAAVFLAAERVTLLLDKKEEPVAEVLYYAIYGDMDDAEATARIQAAVSTIRGWYRGEIPSRDARTSWEAEWRRVLADPLEAASTPPTGGPTS